MEKCIFDLASAIGKIDKDYISVIGFNKDNEEYQQSAEQAFSAELYSQYKQIIESDKTNYYRGLKLQFDLEKERFGSKRPDMVLHTSPTSRNNQKLYIEVKTNPKLTNYDKDLIKLFDATSNDKSEIKFLGFKNAVFICGKKDFTDVTTIISNYIKQHQLNTDERLKRIYLMHFLNTDVITIKLFSELI